MWKYTDQTNSIVSRTLPDGSMESGLASALPDGTQIEAADAPAPLTKDQRKAVKMAEYGAQDVLSVWAFIVGIEGKYAALGYTPAMLYATGNIAYCKCIDLKAVLDAIDAEP